MGLVLLGALLPDIDHPGSSIGRILFFLSQPLERMWGHRTVTHSLLALGAVALASSPLLLFSRIWWFCLLLGYLSHLLIDASNKTGVPLFWPSKSVCVFPYADRFRIATGSMKGEGVLLIFLIILLGMYMPVSNLGLYRAIRYLTATQRSAYSDYRSATTKTLLKFKGIYADTRKPVEGVAPILDGDYYHFDLYFNGRPVSYGEQSDIIPVKSRVLILDEPLKVRKVLLSHCLFSDIFSYADSCLVSGRLIASHEFICSSSVSTIYSSDKKLVLHFASASDLASVSIKRDVDPAFIEQLETDIEMMEYEINTLHRSLPEYRQAHLEQCLAELSVLYDSTLSTLQCNSEPVERLNLQDKLSRIDRERSKIQAQISALDLSDQMAAYKLKKAVLKLDRMNIELDDVREGGVVFSGGLTLRIL